MTVSRFAVSVPIDVARAGLDRVRADNGIDLGLPDDVLVEAEAAIAAHRLPDRGGATVFCPDRKASLHPRVLADDAVSLLPDQARGAHVCATVEADLGKVH